MRERSNNLSTDILTPSVTIDIGCVSLVLQKILAATPAGQGYTLFPKSPLSLGKYWTHARDLS